MKTLANLSSLSFPNHFFPKSFLPIFTRFIFFHTLVFIPCLTRHVFPVVSGILSHDLLSLVTRDRDPSQVEPHPGEGEFRWNDFTRNYFFDSRSHIIFYEIYISCAYTKYSRVRSCVVCCSSVSPQGRGGWVSKISLERNPVIADFGTEQSSTSR